MIERIVHRGRRDVCIAGDEPRAAHTQTAAQVAGLAVRERRLAAGLTLRRCASGLGISPTLLSAIEQGTHVPDDPRGFVERLAAMLAEPTTETQRTLGAHERDESGSKPARHSVALGSDSVPSVVSGSETAE